ncbi:GNAT family N-acetyltransferase [Streptomyces sp. NPDC058427]
MLRAWPPTDAPAVMEAFQDPAIQRRHARRADYVDEAREWIEGWRSSRQQETAGHWAVVDDDRDALLGRVSLLSCLPLSCRVAERYSLGLSDLGVYQPIMKSMRNQFSKS